ncbi:DUF4382 domain-containing protein [Labilibacter sediminis]|nr:DUF4382 domain-containing protein [Labilibacter sediminis]
MNFRTLLVAALLIIGVSIVSCDKDNVSGSGKLKIQLTDAPFPTDLVSEANVTISKIDIRKSGDAEGNPFITLSEEEMSFNLLDLTNGVTASLVDLEIEAGSYDLVRLYVSEASIVLKDGTEFDLKVPSGAQTGIKIFINPSIDVVGGLTAELLLDFNVAKSFVAQGDINSPEGINAFNFTPVIKASNLSTAGRLTGTVTDAETAAETAAIDGAQVSIIAADTVYTTTFSDINGAYAIIGVDAGTYTVEFAKEGFETATIEEVSIIAANETTQDAQLTAIVEEVVE